MLQAQGRITCFPLTALASLFGGVGWGRFVLVADTSRDHTRERRREEGGSLASTRGTEEERQRDKRRQRPVKRKVNRESRRQGQGGRLARPQTENQFRSRRTQRETEASKTAAWGRQPDTDGSGEGRPEIRLIHTSLKRMVGWTQWVGRLGESLMDREEDAQAGGGWGQPVPEPPAC